MDSDSDIVPAAITDDVRIRLNTLNYASSLINKNEAKLDKARQQYQFLFSEATQKLLNYSKKFKSSIEKSRTFYELQEKKKTLLNELQLDSKAYNAVQQEHDEAAAILKLYNIDAANFDENDKSNLDAVNTALKMVNITNVKLDYLRKRHEEILSQCAIVDEDLHTCRSRVGLAIRKSQPYFEVQASFNETMENAKQVINRLTGEVHSAKQLYAKTMRSLEATSNRIHESRRLGHWLHSPLISPRSRGVGAEGTEVVVPDVRAGEEVSASLSLPSSPRHTPPGQADTEVESEAGGEPEFFGSLYVTTPPKSTENPIFSDVVMALQSCSVDPGLQVTQSKGQQTDFTPLTINYQHSRTHSL